MLMINRGLALRNFRLVLSSYLQKNPKLQWRFAQIKHAFRGSYLRSSEASSQEKKGEFVFIVGCGRSGNTLLRRLLMKSYSIYIPPETYVLADQIIRYSKIHNRSWSEKVDAVLSALECHPEFATFGVKSLTSFSKEAKSWSLDRKNFYSLIDGLYRWIGKESGWISEWVGDKTPLNTLNLGIIQKSFPNAKFIYLERDPVDVVHSYLQSGIYNDAGKAAERWVKSTVAWENFKLIHGEDKCVEIRYEVLVKQPEVTLDKIATIFEIPCVLSKYSGSSSFMGDVEAHAHHANSVKPPSAASIGKGRSNLSELALIKIRPIIGGYARKRGYSDI